MFIFLNLFKIIVCICSLYISLDSTVNFSPVLQLGLGSPVASWWLPMGWWGQASGRVKVQDGALQSLADMTQTGLHTIQGSLCQIQSYSDYIVFFTLYPTPRPLYSTSPSLIHHGPHPPWLGYSTRKLAIGHHCRVGWLLVFGPRP